MPTRTVVASTHAADVAPSPAVDVTPSQWPSPPTTGARSCPAPDAAAPIAVAFSPRESLGEVGGVTRVLGTTPRGEWREAFLDGAGTLTLAATAAVPRELQGHAVGHDLDGVAPTDPFDSGYQPGELYRWRSAAGASALTLDGDGPTRRLHVTGPNSAPSTLVADEHTLLVSAVRVGARVLVLWTTAGQPGVRARPFEPDGRPAGDAFSFGADVVYVRALHVWREARASFVAWRDGANAWRAAPIALDARGVGGARALALPDDAFFLTSAVLADGVLFAGFTNSVHNDGGRHSWGASIHSRFVSNAPGAAPEAARQCAHDGGPGRGGLRPFLLVAGARAAVLIASHDGWGAQRSTLIALRVPRPN